MPLLAEFRSTARWLARRGHMEAELDDEFRDRWEREVEQCERRYAARRSQTGGPEIDRTGLSL